MERQQHASLKIKENLYILAHNFGMRSIWEIKQTEASPEERWTDTLTKHEYVSISSLLTRSSYRLASTSQCVQNKIKEWQFISVCPLCSQIPSANSTFLGWNKNKSCRAGPQPEDEIRWCVDKWYLQSTNCVSQCTQVSLDNKSD